MPKAFISETTKLRVIRETALYRSENPDDPTTWSQELEADVSALNAMEGHDLPPNALPGPGLVPMEKCQLLHPIAATEWVIDISTKIFAVKNGILR